MGAFSIRVVPFHFNVCVFTRMPFQCVPVNRVLTVPTVLNLIKFAIDFTDTWCTVLKYYRALASNVKLRCCIVDT